MSEYFLDKIKEYGFLVITLLPLTLTMSLMLFDNLPLILTMNRDRSELGSAQRELTSQIEPWFESRRKSKVFFRYKKSPERGAFFNGAPGGIRTHNLLIRSQMLYPIELRVHLTSTTEKLIQLLFLICKHYFSNLKEF